MGFATVFYMEFSDGTFLMVQWLRPHPSNAGGTGSILGQGAKIPHAAQQGQKKYIIISRKRSYQRRRKTTVKGEKLRILE